MKILVITSKLPYPATGADEQDRFYGIKLLRGLGHQIHVIAKKAGYQKDDQREQMSLNLGVSIDTVPYVDASSASLLKRLRDPALLDGAAYEYLDSKTLMVLERAMNTFKPDVVWLDGSFMWPLIPFIRAHSVPIIGRSLQIESLHILDDEGYSFPNLVRFFIKSLGEKRFARSVDALVAINANEAKRYAGMGAQKVVVMPLRSLPYILETEPVAYSVRKPLRIVFSGSTFNVHHNHAGALKVLHYVAPELERRAPGEFIIHITGAKLPAVILEALPSNVVYEGYVDDYAVFLQNMDIALTQSLGRVGMHGKLFEPLARGIPTITESHARAGFDLEHGIHLFLTTSPEDAVQTIMNLRDVRLRKTIGVAGHSFAQTFFARTKLTETLNDILSQVV